MKTTQHPPFANGINNAEYFAREFDKPLLVYKLGMTAGAAQTWLNALIARRLDRPDQARNFMKLHREANERAQEAWKR